MKVVNFLAGPCSGKSTLCAGLFHEMKRSNLNVEYVHEWAKELTWDERFKCLTDQISILGHQNNMMQRLKGKVDWVVTDTCLLLALMYVKPDYYKNFEPLLLEVYSSYNNINLFIDRPDFYTEVGRNQTFEESKAVDVMVLNLLDKHGIPYVRVPCSISPVDLCKEIVEDPGVVNDVKFFEDNKSENSSNCGHSQCAQKGGTA